MSRAVPEPQAITPPPALGPPIIGTDPGSIPGIPQPVFAHGSATVPATPIPITGTPILPPPQVGFGGNAPAGSLAVQPAPVPPSTAGFTQPQYKTGSATSPTAASLFPAFTAAGASPPIVINSAQNVTSPPSPPGAPPAWIAPPALPLPTTPGIAPIVLNGWGKYAGPAPAIPFPREAVAEEEPLNEDEDRMDDNGAARSPPPPPPKGVAHGHRPKPPPPPPPKHGKKR